MLRFVVGVESQFYPQIDALYRRRIEAWAGRATSGMELGSGERRPRTCRQPGTARVSLGGTAAARAVPHTENLTEFRPSVAPRATLSPGHTANI